jgi:hypothetical protein
MHRTSSAPPADLWQALQDILRRPVRTLVPPWSWKAAACNAVIRAAMFFITNLRSGHWVATKAMLVEAIYAVLVGGLIGAISQQLRRAKPLWATALVVWIGLPGTMLLVQVAIHRIAGTPHLGGGLVISFCLAALASAFSWYAMRQGAMLGGIDQTTITHDLSVLPGIAFGVLLVIPRLLKDEGRRGT